MHDSIISDRNKTGRAESSEAAREFPEIPVTSLSVASRLPGGFTGSLASPSFSSSFSFGRLFSWTIRGGSSVLQQALFGGAHFVTNVLLARWLPPALYGAFALAYSVYLLLLMTYSAIFCEPMMVYGAGRDAEQFPAYVRAVVRVHFLLVLPVGLIFALATPLIGHSYTHEFQTAFLALALLSPLLLLVWLCRAAFYAQLNPHAGTVAGICYFVLLVSLIGALRLCQVLSPVTTVGAMACASVLVSAGCLWFLRKPAGLRRSAGHEITSGSVLRDHWLYGRWAALAAFAGWISTNVFYLALPSRFGAASPAALRVLMNLMYPLLQSESALIVLLIPMLVRQLNRDGLQKMKRTTLRMIALFAPVGIVYLVFLAACGSRILRFLYSGRYSYVSLASILAVGLLPITAGIVGLLGAAVRAIQRPRLAFFAALASASVALAIGVPLTLRYGLVAAAFALVISDLPAIAVLSVMLMRSKPAAGALA